MRKYRIIKIAELHNKEKITLKEKIIQFSFVVRMVMKFWGIKVLKKKTSYFHVTEVD